MTKIGIFNTKYTDKKPKYERSENKFIDINDKQLSDELKRKAKIIAEPILVFDKYEHERAEDSETFFQTLNIELLSIAGVIISLPSTITKLIPLSENKKNNSLVKNICNILKKYENATVKAGNKSIKLQSILFPFSALAGSLFYIKGIKNSMTSQLGLIRKASYDAIQNIYNNPAYYADLTPEQEKETADLIKTEEKNNTAFVDKLKDKININSSFQAVKEYKKNSPDYKEKKTQYFENLKNEYGKKIPLSSKALNNGEKERLLFESYLKNVELDVLEDLKKVETISNISYSAMFTGGFLEYLISDKIIEILGIKNKPVQMLAKLGIPVLTYMLLNKNISDIENKAILAVKYKHLKKFTDNPLNFEDTQNNKKTSLPKFIKEIANDIKEYNKFAENELPKIEKRLIAKTQTDLSEEQLKNAKLLQKNTSTVLNTQRENLYNHSVGIKSISETILGPIDILTTAIGGKIGSSFAKKINNKKFTGLFMGLGAIIAFIPAALAEAKLTAVQKRSEKNAVLKSINDLKNPRIFCEIPDEKYNINLKNKKSKIFSEFN